MNQHLPGNRAETVFEDFKLPLLRDAAMVEANRCLFCSDAPCIKACPTHIDIPQFIHYHLENGRFKTGSCWVSGVPQPVVA